MRDHEILGLVERELVSTCFLAEKLGRRHRPYEPPPKRPKRPNRYTPEAGRAYREARKAKLRAMGIIK